MNSLYGEVIQDHGTRPRNQHALANPTAAHEGLNPLCGDKVKIELRIEDGHISEVGFTSDACMVATAATSILTELVRGRSATEAAAITRETLLNELRTTLRPARINCATLPLDVLRGALEKMRS